MFHGDTACTLYQFITQERKHKLSFKLSVIKFTSITVLLEHVSIDDINENMVILLPWQLFDTRHYCISSACTYTYTHFICTWCNVMLVDNITGLRYRRGNNTGLIQLVARTLTLRPFINV